MAMVDVPISARRRAGRGNVLRSVLLLALAAPTAAADEPTLLLSTRWPGLPDAHRRSLGEHLTEGLDRLGNALGHHLDALSQSTLQLTVDGPRRLARIRIGTGDMQGLSLRLDGEIELDPRDALDAFGARVHARLELGFRGHELMLELPAFEMAPAEYRGDHGVAIKLPLLVRKF